jgi:hypothetical protein
MLTVLTLTNDDLTRRTTTTTRHAQATAKLHNTQLALRATTKWHRRGARAFQHTHPPGSSGLATSTDSYTHAATVWVLRKRRIQAYLNAFRNQSSQHLLSLGPSIRPADYPELIVHVKAQTIPRPRTLVLTSSLSSAPVAAAECDQNAAALPRYVDGAMALMTLST